MCKKFDEWNDKKQQLETRNTKTIAKNIEEGRIYWTYIGVNVGKEMHHNKPPFNRPVLVVKIFKKSGTFLGIPLTSKPKTSKDFFKFTDTNNKIQYAALAQARSFDYRRIKTSGSWAISKDDFDKLKKRWIEVFQ